MLKRLAFTLGLAIAAFLLGWLLGRDGGPDPVAPTAPTAPPAEVELRLDAGGVTLMPDAGLHLKPIEPLDAGLE